MEEQQQTKQSLLRRWLLQPWRRRFSIYGCGFVLLIVLFYTIENIRGTMALNAAKQRAADAGIELDFSKLMTGNNLPDEENFAACMPAIESIGDFTDLHPDFNGGRPHVDFLRTLPRHTGMSYALPHDFSVNFSPRKPSHEAGCRDILTLLNGWDSELQHIAEASRRAHCDFNEDWAGPVDQIITPTDLNVAKTLQLRAIARLGIGDNKGAVSDLETIFRVGQHFDEKPVLLNLLVCSVRIKCGVAVIWEGLNNRQFDQFELQQLANALNSIEPERVWEKSCISEAAFSVAAFSPLIKSASTRFSKSEDSWYTVAYVNSDPLPDYPIVEEVIAFTNRFIFASIPTGWFRRNLAEKIHADVDLFQHQGTLKEELGFISDGAFKTGKYDFIFGESLPPGQYSAILQRFIDSTSQLRLAKTAIAFELHYLKHGTYPTTFEALISEFPDAVPTDPWTDKPLLLDFRADGRPVIYSVGEDLDDDGGIPQTRRKHDGDTVWHYSLPAGFDAEAHFDK